MAHRDRGFIPFQAPINVRVRAFNVGVICHQMLDALPVAAGRNLAVTFQNISRMTRSDVIGNFAVRRVRAHLRQKLVEFGWLTIRHFVARLAVFDWR